MSVFNPKQLVSEKPDQFSPTVNCCDDLFFNNLEMQLSNELASILKIVLILSHGQISVKRNFSVNKTILKNNKCNKTIIDHMKSKGFTKDLLHSVNVSRSRYQEHLRQLRKSRKKIKLLPSWVCSKLTSNKLSFGKKYLSIFVIQWTKNFLS